MIIASGINLLTTLYFPNNTVAGIAYNGKITEIKQENGTQKDI